MSRASGASAGRINTRVWNRSLPTRTSMRWASRVRSFPRRTPLPIASSASAQDLTRLKIRRMTASTSSRSRTSCARRRHPRAERSPAKCEPASDFSIRSVATRATSTRCAPSRPGTLINGGKFRVPEALGNKIFHPYSDFLLHDIDTGDDIPVLPGPEYAETSAQIRTAPLWALRTRNRLMHDGLSFTKQEAILRHGGQATAVRGRFNALSEADQDLLMTFLDSL